MPQVESVKTKSSKVGLIVGILTLVVVGGGVVAVVLLVNRKPAPQGPSTASILTEANNLEFSHQGSQAIAMLRAQLKYAKNQQETAQIDLDLGQDLAAAGQTQSAIQEYQSAAGSNPNASIEETIAQLEQDAGNKAQAINYYTKAEKQIQSGQDKADYRDLPFIQSSLQSLGASS